MNEHKLLTNSDYKIDIGIEVHVQLNTKSKIFCYCQNGPAEQANTNICQICTGQPGVLPVLNKEVVNSAVLVGLATNYKKFNICPQTLFLSRLAKKLSNHPKRYSNLHRRIC